MEKEIGERNSINNNSKENFFKKLIINKGKKGGLQFHRKKDECGYIESGKLFSVFICYENSKGKISKKILKKGDVFHFPPGAIHQEEALTKCVIIEASTPHFNDRVRVEDKFGIKAQGGLPTTKVSQIRLK